MDTVKHRQRNPLPELLSPAGNLECALAAFDGGADAVYCGLARFNARERAQNFSSDDLGRLIAFARRTGKKVYLACNTLVEEGELAEAVDLLAEAARLAPDALIVQDLGVLRICREYFPSLALHASTQMGIHNSAGVAAAAELGIRRVILERQLTMEELRAVAAVSPVELEVFIHGSLCCSLSGQCLLSAAVGGGSGNRGRCKQPCRRRFETAQARGYLLSLRDLNGLDRIPELIELGIASLKIEGRLRSADYVWKSARAYRLVLDNGAAARAEADALLRATPSRGVSGGFFSKRRWKELIDRDRPGVFGVPVGEVLRAESGGIAVRAAARLHLGDRLRFSAPGGGDGESFSLTALRENGHEVLKVRAGTECFLPGVFRVPPGTALCKIGENGFDFSRRAAALPPPRRRVRLTVSAAASHWRVAADGIDETWERVTKFSPALRRALSAAEVEREFASGVPEPYEAEPEAAVEGSFFVPASELKKLRREFWAWAAERFRPENSDDGAADGVRRFREAYDAMKPAPEAPPEQGGRCYEIPVFVPEGRLAAQMQAVQAAYASGIRSFRVGGLHALTLLAPYPGVKRTAVFPLHVANSLAAAELKALGVAAAEAAAELDRSSLALLREHAPLPVAAASPVPLLTTRLELPPGEWRDGGGNRYTLRRRDGLSMLTAPGRPAAGSGDDAPPSADCDRL